jgi:dihydropyrimidinase
VPAESLLIRDGTVVTAQSARQADVLIRSGKIAQVAPAITEPEADVVDATNCVVMPGVVDPHTHFKLESGGVRSADDFATASRSAAAGGVTTFLDFAPQQPADRFLETLKFRREQINGRTLIDYAVHLNINRLYPGWEDDLRELVQAGVTSAKVYTTYRDTIFYVDDWTWYRLMERAGETGFLVQVHAENDAIIEGRTRELIAAGRTSFAYHAASRPAVAEAEAVNRGITFSRATGSPVYFVHLSNPLSVDLVTEARERGIMALAETCPHFLTLDDSRYAGPEAARYLMTPPLRPLAMQQALWERVSQGAVHAIGSDHCGFSLDTRAGVTDFSAVTAGIPGVETSLLLLHSYGVRPGRIDWPALVRLLCANPAKIFGLAHRKGDLQPGLDADVVVFDPHEERILSAADLHSAAGYTPYEGLPVTGRVRTTISRGVPIYKDGVLHDAPGHGQFVPCDPFDPLRNAFVRKPATVG